MAKKPKKYRPTTKAMVVSAIRRYIWLRSRERGECLKRHGYRCVACNMKKSTAKGKEVTMDVHHKSGETKIGEAADIILEHLLCDVEDLEPMCDPCHKGHHAKDET